MQSNEDLKIARKMVAEMGAKTKAFVVIELNNDGTCNYNTQGQLSDICFMALTLTNYAQQIMNGTQIKQAAQQMLEQQKVKSHAHLDQ
jgi:hypothetical protein